MKYKSLIILIILLFLPGMMFFGCETKTKSLEILKMECEYQSNPMAIDKLSPRLSWQIYSPGSRGEKQTAYRILVASTLEKLREGRADLWDSKKIQSDQSRNILYAGNKLDKGMNCYWKVMIWDKDENPGDWSETAHWHMGLLQKEDWKSVWIGSPEPLTSPYYRHSFQVEKMPEEAIIYLAPLGYFQLYINGNMVGNEVLAPAVSNFSKRSYYRCFDILPYLKKGLNSIGIWMGTGWYNTRLPGVMHHSPSVRAQIELKEKGEIRIIPTDTSWEYKASERMRLGQWKWGDFGGEVVDAGKLDTFWWDPERSVKNWADVVKVNVADVPCTAQPCAGNTPIDYLSPIRLEQLDNGMYLIDFGLNFTGMVSMKFRNLEPGDTIDMYYADKDARGTDFKGHNPLMTGEFSTMGQYDRFISAGEKDEVFENVFNYHAFRYMLIEGLPYLPELSDIGAYPIETTTTEIGKFSCSNELYNRIHEMVKWTYRCLSLGGQTVDCPHRERLGYGDGQTIMDLGLYNFDNASLYAKWSQNWWDEQNEDGFVPFTAPRPHGTGGGLAWGAMSIVVPWKTCLFSNDLRLLKEGYPYMKRYIEYLESYCSNGLLQDIFPGKKWKNLGDWVPPGKGMDQKNWVDDSSRRFFNNCYRIYLLRIMQDVARMLDKKQDEALFRDQMAHSCERIHQTWYNPKDSSYANGEQPYLILPLQTNITPDSLKEAVFEKYVRTLLYADNGHLNTGMIGTQLMTDYLCEIDRNDLVDTYVNKKTYPGWGYMVECGATTCWEQWNGNYSQIHSCFPYIGGWFYKGLAGIRWDPETPGFKNVILKPALVESVDWVDCEFTSDYGLIESRWSIEDQEFSWKISVPANSTATVYIPGKEIMEGGLDILQSVGISFLSKQENYSVFEFPSGTFSIEAKL